jgi:hypothetical protein
MSAPSGPLRQARICIRFPFDISFPPIVPAPVPFVADGNAQPPGGPGFTVQGTLFDLAGAIAQSNTLTVNFMQGVWSMGPFTRTGTPMPMLPGDYVLRVNLMQGPVQRDQHEITVRLI